MDTVVIDLCSWLEKVMNRFVANKCDRLNTRGDGSLEKPILGPWDLKKGSGFSNPVECGWNSCCPLSMSLTWDLVGSALPLCLFFLKRKRSRNAQLLELLWALAWRSQTSLDLNFAGMARVGAVVRTPTYCLKTS
jgi:hypothetical protein